MGTMCIESTIPSDVELKLGIIDNAVSKVLSAPTIQNKLDQLAVAIQVIATIDLHGARQ